MAMNAVCGQDSGLSARAKSAPLHDRAGAGACTIRTSADAIHIHIIDTIVVYHLIVAVVAVRDVPVPVTGGALAYI